MKPWLILFAAVGMCIGIAFGLGLLAWLVGAVFGPTTSQAYVVIYIVCLFLAVMVVHWLWTNRHQIPRLLRARWKRGKMIRSEFDR